MKRKPGSPAARLAAADRQAVEAIADRTLAQLRVIELERGVAAIRREHRVARIHRLADELLGDK